MSSAGDAVFPPLRPSLLCSLHAAALTRQIGAPTSSLPRGTKTATSAAAHLAMPFSFRLRALPTWGTADCVDSDAIMKMVYILYREAHGKLGKKEFAGERLMMRFVLLCSVIAPGGCLEQLQTRAHLCVVKRKQLHVVLLRSIH